MDSMNSMVFQKMKIYLCAKDNNTLKIKIALP
ncbi:hypothetical protein TVTCOM_17980 [Terrisporobacter vanillatitrophus]